MSLDELMNGVTPNLGPFAASLGPKLVMILGVIWLLALVLTVALVIKGTVEFAASRSGGRPMAAADGVADIGVPVMALVFLGIVPAAVTALV